MRSLVKIADGIRSVNIWVVFGMLISAIILGVLNNLRVYEEQRVSLWEDAADAEDMEESVEQDDGANP